MKKKNFRFSEFTRLNIVKLFLFVLLLMALTIFSLKSSYPWISDLLVFANAALNTLLIILCYILACAVAWIAEKVKSR
jgi:hypothetical protein